MEDNIIFNHKYIRQIHAAPDLPDIIYDAIKEAIVSGKLLPGSKLKQVDIAKKLGVSQQTVREALKQLLYRGWVVQKPNCGFTVSGISIKEQDEIMEIRKVLEIYAFEKATNKLSASDLSRMRELLPIADYSKNEELANSKTIQANIEFHMIPIRTLGNTYLTRIMEDMWSRLWVYHFRDENDEEYKKSALEDLEQHKKILDAFERRDAEQVRKTTLDHLNSAIDALWQVKNVMKTRGY